MSKLETIIQFAKLLFGIIFFAEFTYALHLLRIIAHQ